MDASTALFIAVALPLIILGIVSFIIVTIVGKLTRGIVRSGRKTHAVIMNRPYVRR